MSEEHNAPFDSNDPDHRMMNAMIMDSSVGGCANAAKVARERGDKHSKWQVVRPDSQVPIRTVCKNI